MIAWALYISGGSLVEAFGLSALIRSMAVPRFVLYFDGGIFGGIFSDEGGLTVGEGGGVRVYKQYFLMYFCFGCLVCSGLVSNTHSNQFTNLRTVFFRWRDTERRGQEKSDK